MKEDNITKLIKCNAACFEKKNTFIFKENKMKEM